MKYSEGLCSLGFQPQRQRGYFYHFQTEKNGLEKKIIPLVLNILSHMVLIQSPSGHSQMAIEI